MTEYSLFAAGESTVPLILLRMLPVTGACPYMKSSSFVTFYQAPVKIVTGGQIRGLMSWFFDIRWAAYPVGPCIRLGTSVDWETIPSLVICSGY